MNHIVATLLVTFLAAPLAGVATVHAQEITRYVRYEQGGTTSWGILEGETIHQLSAAPYLDGRRTGQSVPLAQATLRAPVDPKVSVLITGNYASAQTGRPRNSPGTLLVPPTATTVPGPVTRPPDSDNLHIEGTAVIVIGRRARNVSEAEAGGYIFGVAPAADVTEMGWRQADTQWTRAKGADTFKPVGPVLARGADYANLTITSRHNGSQVAQVHTRDMTWNFHQLVSYVSGFYTLEPGDIIWAGTTGQTFAVQPGDTFDVEVGGVGILQNRVVQGTAATDR